MSSIPIGGSLAVQAQTSLLQSREDHMLHQLDAIKGSNDDAKIDKSAQEFESMLLSTWLQQAEQSMASVPGAEDDDDGSGGQRDQIMSMGVQSLSAALSASGGIGIGKMIAHSLHAAADKRQALEAIANKGVDGSGSTVETQRKP